MIGKNKHRANDRRRSISNQGFTLIELLIAMVVSVIVMAGVYSAYHSQQTSYVVQEQVAGMQQNLRGALAIMDRDIRMAGYDPGKTGAFGITDITLDAGGNWTLQFEADFDEDDILGADETFTSSVIDDGNDGDLDLARDDGGGAQLLAENIEWVGLAYAYDSDADGEIDFDDSNGNGQRDAGEPLIWAIDTNDDNQLDLNLDTNDDGVLDENDDTDGDGLIEGQALAAAIPTTAIRAVRIWLLARTDKPIKGFSDTKTYVVGDVVVTPTASYRHYLLTSTIKCRNMGLL